MFKVLLLASVIGFVTTRNFQKRDYIPPRDWVQCNDMNHKCEGQLESVKNLMNGGFRNLVSHGNLNINCSTAARAEIEHCYSETSKICFSAISFDLQLWHLVYNYVCPKEQGFIAAGPCLSDGTADTARQQCGVGRDYYTGESDCRNAPDCVYGHILNSPHCSSVDATLLKNMVEKEYEIQMYECGLYMM